MVDAARTAVDALYTLRDNFFNTNGVDKASKKAQMVKTAMHNTLDQLGPLLSESTSSSPELLYLKGKAHNVEESFSQEAEDALAKAVKLDPKLLEGWNALGECYWKKGDKEQAFTCFDGALAIKPNKVSMQHKSMLLRQLPATTEVERINRINDSLDIAKDAIKLDLKDGHSWYVLGNAYLALFFAKMETVDHMKQALKAYKKAEEDKTEAVNNPDLHQNRATVHEYLEDYHQAIEGYMLANVIDPDWPQPKQALEMLKGLQTKICDLIEKRAGLKAKALTALKDSLTAGTSLSDYCGLAGLKPGVNSGMTQVAICSVFAETSQSPAQIFIGVDAAGEFCAVTVYNTVPSVLKMNDVIEVPEPLLQPVKLAKLPINGEEGFFEYTSIRVDNPVTMQVNGTPLGTAKLVKNVIAY